MLLRKGATNFKFFAEIHRPHSKENSSAANRTAFPPLFMRQQNTVQLAAAKLRNEFLLTEERADKLSGAVGSSISRRSIGFSAASRRANQISCEASSFGDFFSSVRINSPNSVFAQANQARVNL